MYLRKNPNCNIIREKDELAYQYKSTFIAYQFVCRFISMITGKSTFILMAFNYIVSYLFMYIPICSLYFNTSNKL